MEFKDIKQWQVENGIAKPVDHRSKEDVSLIVGELELQLSKSRERIVRLKFEQFAQQHTYATDAPPGIHSAEMFGEVVWQYQSNCGKNSDRWFTIPKYIYERRYKDSNYNTRQFLPFKHPVEPNDKQQYPPDFLDFCSIMETGKVQPLNTNANAIKIIQAEMVSLNQKLDNEYLYGSSAEALNIEYALERFRHILKLLQS